MINAEFPLDDRFLTHIPPEFKSFPKIHRLSRDMIITEKIDGTNTVVYVDDDGTIHAGSRHRWITPASDHYGFAKWVGMHTAELRELGGGYHFGEWWGQGINRGYGLHENRWSLFNVLKWGAVHPACCHVVPVLYRGLFNTTAVEQTFVDLTIRGSIAAPGFMRPEGIVVYHTQGRVWFKQTIENDA